MVNVIFVKHKFQEEETIKQIETQAILKTTLRLNIKKNIKNLMKKKKNNKKQSKNNNQK